MAEKTPRELLKTATGEDWRQMGSLLIARCEGSGKSRDVAEALREFGIEAQVSGLNAVQVSLHATQGLDAQKAGSIKDYLTNGEQEVRPKRDLGHAR